MGSERIQFYFVAKSFNNLSRAWIGDRLKTESALAALFESQRKQVASMLLVIGKSITFGQLKWSLSE